MSGDVQTRTVPARLRLQWVVVAVAALALLVVGDLFLSETVGQGVAKRWVLVAGGVLAFELWFLGRHLDQNRVDGDATSAGDAGDGEDSVTDGDEVTDADTPDADATDGGADHLRVFPSLGPGNVVTLVRGTLYAAVAGFLLVPPASTVAWIPALCYGGGAALDWIDGRIARWIGHATVLGEKLDMAFDTLGFLVAPLVAVAWGRLPVWYLSLSLARYLFRAGLALRRRRGRPVYDLPESRIRRPLAGLQMAFIAFALAPVVPAATLHVTAAVVLSPSLLVFVRDYLVVSGRLSRDDRF